MEQWWVPPPTVCRVDHPGGTVGLRLVHHEVTGTGLLLLEYEAAAAAPVAEYDGVAALVCG